MRVMARRLLIASVMALLLAGPAGAGTIIVKLTFVPGKLTLKSPAATIAAGASIQVPVTVADARGNGRGWTLKLTDATDVQIVSITASCAANSTCKLPTAAAAASGSTVLRATQGTGMGVVNLVVTLRAASKTTVAFTVS
jgi:hypothetical protein